MTFDDLMLDEQLLITTQQLAFETVTPVQVEAIPTILEGKDVLACAATGTGKTLAFVIPVLQLLIDEPRHADAPRVLVLAPTRELAYQIKYVFDQFINNLDSQPNIAIITGGFAHDKQLQWLEKDIDIVIATPGRLLSFVSDESIDLSDIDMVVIDEADRMLDMGQGPDVLSSLATIANGFQACLFSATLAGNGVEIFAEELLRDAEYIQINSANALSEQIDQKVIYADDKAHKQALLTATVTDPICQSALVFCNKKERAMEVAEWLQSQNISAQFIHGDLNQATRIDKHRKFRNGQIKVMVATDVAARGLDMTTISHVINYDLPFKGDIYIHRIGRTGRGVNTGTAISLVEQYDQKNLERIEFHLKAKLPVAAIKGMKAKLAKKIKKDQNKDKPRYVSKAKRQQQETQQ
jgi:ATP-dependent RNA helicase SrmB